MHTLWDEVAVQEAGMLSAHGSLAVTQVMLWIFWARSFSGWVIRILHISDIFALYIKKERKNKRLVYIRLGTVNKQTHKSLNVNYEKMPNHPEADRQLSEQFHHCYAVCRVVDRDHM